VINLTEAETSIQHQLIKRHVGWLYALKSNLRNLNPLLDAEPYLTEEDKSFLKDKVNVPAQVIMLQARDLKQSFNSGEMTNYNYIQIDETLNEFYNLQGRCERIKSTVFPKEFSILAKIFVISFTTLVPFHLIDAVGLFIVPIAVFEGFVFYTLAEIPSLYENPFNNHYQDTPLDAISRTIERDLFQMIEDPEIPPVIELKNGILH
jgi:putative membrane protein